MQHTKADTTYIIRIDKGGDVVKTITNFCKEEGIENAYFTGIGAVGTLTCGYYNLEEKKYYFKEYAEPLEVVSLTGNVMLKDGVPFVHAHGVFTDIGNKAFGGHVVEMRVHVVLEVILTPLQSRIGRVLDDCIGLSLMKMD
jgi:predicted DNA-binding protein with PD1-like motif